VQVWLRSDLLVQASTNLSRTIASAGEGLDAFRFRSPAMTVRCSRSYARASFSTSSN
jgi:hypothetical protein